MPGREIEKTCSMPSIWSSTCSAGPATRRSTSALEAPGKGISTLAIVTLICGSSSRGVMTAANRPSRKSTSASSGVIALRWKSAVMRPAMPSVDGLSVLMADYFAAAAEASIPALTGSSATFSPALSPASTSTRPSGKASPSRTWRCWNRPSAVRT